MRNNNLPTIDPGHNISAITGVDNSVGDYRGPVKNHAPNPDGYWWGQVLTPYGWKHIQEIGRAATVEKMIACGARYLVSIPEERKNGKNNTTGN